MMSSSVSIAAISQAPRPVLGSDERSWISLDFGPRSLRLWLLIKEPTRMSCTLHLFLKTNQT
jgi:hypothetical protein